MIDHAGILSILPHRWPMLLVDVVTELEREASLVARKAISSNEPCYDRIPDEQVARCAYPPTLLIESFCQAAGILCLIDAPDRIRRSVILFGAITRFELFRPVFPGETLEHRVQLERRLSDAAVFTGEVHVGGQCVARVERIVVALRPREVAHGGQ